MSYPRLLAEVARTAWVIEPAKGEIIAEFLTRKARGEDIPEAGIQAAKDKNRTGTPRQRSAGLGYIPVFGVLTHRANLITDASGLLSAEEIGAAVDDMADDQSIDSIVMEFDTPGGSVAGIPELAAKIAAAAKKKKVIGVVNALAASGGYWLASQASELVVSPSAEVGSIGVYQMHVDRSRANDQAGVKVTYIKAGENKTAGNPHEPLTPAAVDELQKCVDDYYKLFVKDVAAGRKTTQTAVRGGFGRGGMVRAKEAVAEGMADRVATLDDVLGRYGFRMTPKGLVSASLTAPRPAAALDHEIEIRRRRLILSRSQDEDERAAGEWRKLRRVPGEAAAARTNGRVETPVTDWLRATAHHEAGHAVASEALGYRVFEVSIVPTGDSSGHCEHAKATVGWHSAVIAYAGWYAEHFPGCPALGRYSAGFDDAVAAAALPEGYRGDARRDAESLVYCRSYAVRALAAALLKHRTMSGDQVRAVIAANPNPNTTY